MFVTLPSSPSLVPLVLARGSKEEENSFLVLVLGCFSLSPISSSIGKERERGQTGGSSSPAGPGVGLWTVFRVWLSVSVWRPGSPLFCPIPNRTYEERERALHEPRARNNTQKHP